ncbi:unnamed protein product [Cuscuta europaea]|uniref:Pentatricopeptide repeat-containing protein n=1 Tax=Cuscuta europaea TaxID=41803 RepID=A0A9P1EGF3_CUSEU|nr:unnamed protein product [Cuscuta europaea]
MAHLSYRLNPKLIDVSTPLYLRSTSFFCSSPSVDSEIPISSAAGAQDAGTLPISARTLRGKPNPPEKPEDIICRMMANRAWTTRLQNSIRNLVPVFDHDLVYNVLHAARTSEHALQFFRWVHRAGLFRHNRETHFKIIQILGRASKLNHARCILLDMPKNGVDWDEDLWVVMIESYGQAGIVQESVKLFQRIEELGVERTLKSYNALFKVITRRGRYMMAKRYFNKMLKEGIEPTTHTYNLLIWGFFLASKVETANRFFEEMKSREINPDLVTYNTMINGYIRGKKMEEAEKYFMEMKARNFEPSVITYTTLIKGYNSVGRVDEALKLFQEMKSFGIKPNEATYSTLLPGLCEAEKMSEAKTILKEMEGKYIAPRDNSIFVRLLSGQCKVGDLDAAMDVLNAMIRLSIPTESGHYGVLIENFCKAGIYERAIKLLDKLVEKNIVLRPENTFHMDPSAYNVIIDHLCNNGQTSKAEVFMRQLMKIGIQDPVALNNLIRGHAREGDLESASELLKIMVRRKVLTEESAFNSLVYSYLKKGDPSEAKIVLDSMIENGHFPDSSLYKSVMESLYEDGRIQTASRVMKTMLDKGVKEHADLIGKILESLLMRGHIEETLGRIELMMQNGLSPDFDALLTILCEKEKTIAALKLLDYCLERDFSIEFSSYDKVLDALLAAGKTLNAYSIMCKITEKGGGGVKDHKSIEGLIKSLNKEGNTKQADILSRMVTGKDKDSKKGKKSVLNAA